MTHTERAAFLFDNLDLPAASGVESARWEYFQIQHLNSDDVFRIENKARQIAWSFTVAAEAMASAILTGQGSIFVSINLDEAAEKIRYAHAIYNNLQISGLPKIVRDNIFGIELDNGGRLISLPSKPPRGKARMNVYLDEFAHARFDRPIYTAAMPVISKGGRLRIGSSPLGGSGIFWEIYAEELRRYPGYIRKATPWWETYSFCRNPVEARKLAPAMTTAQRVELFGNDRIKAIYANMLEEDFQQEYECIFVDESSAWIPWALIQRAQHPELKHWHLRSTGNLAETLREMLDSIAGDSIESSFTAGIDVGRRHDLSELFVVGKSRTGTYPVRLMVSLDRVPFDEQAACFSLIFDTLPITGALIDDTGIGMQLAENLARGRHFVQGATFTNQTKEIWAVETKLQFDRGNILIPADRDLAYQIHSIKKQVTQAKNIVFDTERNEKHHADKFWGLALALYAMHRPHTTRMTVV
jgi:phage FluMu gp28-like protein